MVKKIMFDFWELYSFGIGLGLFVSGLSLLKKNPYVLIYVGAIFILIGGIIRYSKQKGAKIK